MIGKVVFGGKTKKGNHIVIRYPNASDAAAMCEYINTLSKERTFIRFQGEEISMEDEERYLSEQLAKIEQNKSVQLLVFCNDQLIGNSQLDIKDRTESHEGVFGISLAKDYRGEGIGRLLMHYVLEEAEKHMPGLRIVTLSVFGDNPVVQELYQKMGFVEFGRLPEGVLHKGQYVDHIYLYKKIR